MSRKAVRENTADKKEEAGLLTRREEAAFCAWLQRRGLKETSVKEYRRAVERLAQYLTREQFLQPGGLERVKARMKREGYAVKTVNRYLAIANILLEFLGHRELQVRSIHTRPREKKAALSRDEYSRLLKTARQLGRERSYFLVKLFANTDLPVQQCRMLTVEALKSGRLLVPYFSLHKEVALPASLCRELLDYAGRRGIQTGPVFLSGRGLPMGRGKIAEEIHRLSLEAGLPSELGNPRCLRNMYEEFVQGLYQDVETLIMQAYERRLEEENRLYGWDAEP